MDDFKLHGYYRLTLTDEREISNTKIFARVKRTEKDGTLRDWGDVAEEIDNLIMQWERQEYAEK